MVVVVVMVMVFVGVHSGCGGWYSTILPINDIAHDKDTVSKWGEETAIYTVYDQSQGRKRQILKADPFNEGYIG